MRLYLAMLLIITPSAWANAATGPRAGDIFEIRTDRESDSHGNALLSSRGTTTDQDEYQVTIVEVRSDGVVEEYDLPPDTTADERARSWEFPLRILRLHAGPVRLLNAPELTVRVDHWLKAGKLSRAMCGKTVFTWNAFRIECDPQSLIPWVQRISLPVHLAAGAAFTDPDALAPAPLRSQAGGKLTADLIVNPDAIRRERASADVGVAALMNKPLTIEAALAKHAAEAISGTIAVTFETDAAGQARRIRERVVQTNWSDGRIDVERLTETLTRTPIGNVRDLEAKAHPR